MILPCLAWGVQQVAIKTIAEQVSPMLQISLRSGVAALLVWLFNRLVSRESWLDGVGSRSGVVVGALFAIEFLFIAEGLRWTSASHMSVFLYTAPLFAAIGLHLCLPEERLTAWQWLGLGLAFSSVAVTFLAPGAPDNGSNDAPNPLLGDFLGLCAGTAWGMTTVVIRTTRLSNAPATQTLFYQLTGACVLLLPVALLSGQSIFRPTALAWVNLAFQTIVISVAANLTWFWLLRKYFAAQLGVLLFMTPLFGVALGVLLLGEQLASSFVTGSALMLAGLLIVNFRAWLPLVLRRHRRA